MDLDGPSCPATHCCDWQDGAANVLNILKESNYVRQPRSKRSPPASPNDNPKLPPTDIWPALPEATRRQILNVLMRMVMESLAAVPAEREVQHDR